MIPQNYNRSTNVAMEHNLDIEPMNIHPPKQGYRNNKNKMRTIRFMRLFFKMLGTPAWYKGIDHPTLWQRITWRTGPALAWKVAIMCYFE